MLKTWPRAHFEPGGGDPHLFFKVHGRFSGELELSASRYRTTGVPDGCTLTSCSRSDTPEALELGLAEGLIADALRFEKPALYKASAASDQCVILQGDVADPDSLDYLRDAVGVVTALLDAGGVSVFDPHLFRWWSPDEWRADLFDADAPVPHRHVVIMASEEPGPAPTTWFHTRGLRKFGRPDLSVRGVTPQQQPAVIDLCDRFIQLQALGGVIPEGQPVRMASLPDDWVCRHRGDVDDPDFNNRHLEVGPVKRPRSRASPSRGRR